MNYIRWQRENGTLDKEGCKVFNTTEMIKENQSRYNDIAQEVFGNTGRSFENRAPEDVELFLTNYYCQYATLHAIEEVVDKSSPFPSWNLYYTNRMLNLQNWEKPGLDRTAKCFVCYSDHLVLHDYDRYGAIAEKVFGNSGQSFYQRTPESIEKFLSLYLDKPVTLQAVIFEQDRMRGFPVWAFAYTEG